MNLKSSNIINKLNKNHFIQRNTMILLINIKKKNNLYNQQGLEINNLKKNKLRNLIQQ